MDYGLFEEVDEKLRKYDNTYAKCLMYAYKLNQSDILLRERIEVIFVSKVIFFMILFFGCHNTKQVDNLRYKSLQKS